MVGYNFIILRAKNVESIVKVTRRGQTTIPVKIREQCGIKEGDQLLVEVTEKGILFKPIPKLEDMAGIDADYGTPEEIKKEIDKLREEY
jgi:AbrB family looped-hinge helix DNA binding protein